MRRTSSQVRKEGLSTLPNVTTNEWETWNTNLSSLALKAVLLIIGQ